MRSCRYSSGMLLEQLVVFVEDLVQGGGGVDLCA